MANICTFKMVVRGSKENIDTFLPKIRCYDMRLIGNEVANDGSVVYKLLGETRWNVTESIATPLGNTSLKDLTSDYCLETEIFGYDTSEPNWIEHYHYRNGIAIKEFNLPAWFEAWEYEDGEVSVDISKYNYHEEAEVYSLKKECSEPFEWDEENQDMVVSFDMLK